MIIKQALENDNLQYYDFSGIPEEKITNKEFNINRYKLSYRSQKN